MARPKKNSCDYFPHDSNMRNHTKVRAVRQKFSNGYAIWCMLIEYLTGSDGNEFENTETEYELLSGDFGVSATEIQDVVKYCIKLEMLFEENGFIYSDSLNERLAPVYAKRGSKRELSKKQRRRNGQYVTENTAGNGVSVTEMPQSKVKETKVNDSEVKETINSTSSNSFSFTPDPVIPIKNLVIQYKSDELWVANVTKSLSLKGMTEVGWLLDRFAIHLETQKMTEKTEKDFREHFTNWARKQKPEQPPNTFIGFKDHLL